MTQSMIELKIPTPIRTFGATVTIEGELPTFRDGGVVYPRWPDDPLANSYWGADGARDARFLVYIGASGLDFASITDDMMTEVTAVDVDYAGPSDLGISEIAHPAFTHRFAHSFTVGAIEFTLSNFRFDNLVTPAHLVVDYTTSTGVPSNRYVRFYGGNLRYWSATFLYTDPLANGIYGAFGDLIGPVAPGASGSLTLNVSGLYGTLPHSVDIYEYYLCPLVRSSPAGTDIEGPVDVGSSYDASPRNAFQLKDIIPATPANLQSLYIKYAPTAIPVGAPRGVAVYNVTVEGYKTTYALGSHSTSASFY